MSYLVLARKYRPGTFSEVSGQEHVTRTLANGITRGKIAHAFLFCGPRGVGKTSVARILSKSLNCREGPTPEPCGKCTNCGEISAGSSLAVREIDGASHNSVDNVRDLIDSFRSLPAPGYRYKIYIIDEVHMLSISAFNALLKSLEEPPPHTIFILATTEAHKVPETVISRCQQHTFRAIAIDAIETRLAHIVKKEGLKVEDGVLRMVANQADGSMRDAQSLLDKVQLFCDKNVTMSEAGRLLGAADKAKLFELSEAILAHDTARCLSVVSQCFETGVDASLFLKDFMRHWREILLAQLGGESLLHEAGVSSDDGKQMMKQAQSLRPPELQKLVETAREGADSALRSAFPKYALEALVVRMALIDRTGDAGEHSTKQGNSQKKTASLANSAKSANSPSGPRSSGSPKACDWKEFVHFASQRGPRFVYEHLKRISAVEFGGGVLRAAGPQFSIQYLDRPDEKKKLCELLEEYSGIPGWSVKFASSDEKTEAEGSILHMEKMRAKHKREERTRDISQHPKIQSLKKAFPGTEIEHIRIKEEE